MLLVAATALELNRLEDVEMLVCGIGPVEAAASTARRLAAGSTPNGLLHVGIAGARDLKPGTLVLGSEAVYCDLGVESASVPIVTRAAPDEVLLRLASEALPEAVVCPIGTSARVGGTAAHHDVEAMEGFAVLRAAEQAGVPALELRAISNRYADTREEWRIEEALAALAGAVPRLLELLDA